MPGFVGLPQSAARKASREMVIGVRNSGVRWLYQKHLDEKTASNEFAVSLMKQTSDASKNPYHQLLATNLITVPGGLADIGFDPSQWGASSSDDVLPGQSSTWSIPDGTQLVPSPIGTGSLHSQYGLATSPSGGSDWTDVLKSFATSVGSGFGFRLAGGQLPTNPPPPSSFPVGKALVIGGAIAIPLIYLLTRRS